ncbi:MAG: Zn-dependent exopeptidase M28 [Deltaproteobacteria bacterium]|nr:Zn-dependent exopeptidase M28 [Deltaproteobacteria bacterium]MDQ3295734.1 M28 family metallopeptidase [Myxococcota bacterium]
MKPLVACALAVAACAPAEDGTATDAGTGDARADAPPGCTRPALEQPWLRPLLTGTIAQLASTPRSTTTQREAARTYLSQQLQMIGWTPQLHAYPGGANVVTTVPATVMPPANTIIVGAHFDSVAASPGANDNASGTAVVLAVARYLAETPCRTAPVRVVFFDQEEVGLFGARAYAAIVDPATVRAVHTIDQVSWDGDSDGRFELELPTPELETEWRAAAAIVGVTVATTSTSGTDHEAFRDRGFAAVGLTEEYVGGDTSPHRHLAGDTPATVDNDYLTLAAKLTAQVVIEEAAP